jgi:primosomal protein N'
MDDYEPCPNCVGNGICPKCDSKMIYDEETGADRCPVCGYNDATGEVDSQKEKRGVEF